MRRASKCIASVLLAVFLATLLAPSFGWEASAGQAKHGHDVAVLGDAHGQDSHELFHEAHATGGDEDSRHHHHGCAGHMFSHLSAMLGKATGLALPDADDATVFQRMLGVITSFPKRLDRPPYASDLA